MTASMGAETQEIEDGPSGWSVQRSSLREQVVRLLTDEILAGGLAPGEPLRQIQLAERLRISRTPLREALRVLRADGLVVQLPNGTYQVVAPSLDDARDMYDLRRVIDPFAAGRAARDATAQQIDELKDLVAVIARVSEPFDPPRYLAAIADFHVTMLKASGNRAILALESTVRMSVRVLYSRLRGADARVTSAAGEYRAIFDAVRDRNELSAERLASDHVDAVAAFWLSGA